MSYFRIQITRGRQKKKAVPLQINASFKFILSSRNYCAALNEAVAVMDATEIELKYIYIWRKVYDTTNMTGLKIDNEHDNAAIT